MRITPREETISFLEREADQLGLAPEELAERIIDQYAAEHGKSNYRLLSYSELLEKSINGTTEERVIANTLRTRFIR